MQPGKPIAAAGDASNDSKKFIEVGKYILFDSNVNNDTLNTAYNSENHNFYTWKVSRRSLVPQVSSGCHGN